MLGGAGGDHVVRLPVDYIGGRCNRNGRFAHRRAVLKDAKDFSRGELHAGLLGNGGWGRNGLDVSVDNTVAATAAAVCASLCLRFESLQKVTTLGGAPVREKKQ